MLAVVMLFREERARVSGEHASALACAPTWMEAGMRRHMEAGSLGDQAKRDCMCGTCARKRFMMLTSFPCKACHLRIHTGSAISQHARPCTGKVSAFPTCFLPATNNEAAACRNTGKEVMKIARPSASLFSSPTGRPPYPMSLIFKDVGLLRGMER